jgi:flagellar biosynthesis/type III secretory pathway protein FliH
MIVKGRVIKGAFADDAVSSAAPTARTTARTGEARRIDGAIVVAHAEAERVAEEAKTRAAALVEDAKKQLARVAEDAAKDAREAEVAKLAAGFIALRAAEQTRAERALAETTEIAKMLAERLLGEALQIEPARVTQLAKMALAEARGARRAKIRACAEDARVLATRLGELGVAPNAIEVTEDESLARGSLVIDTDLGVLDARLAPQLDRLTETLREVLRSS